MRRTRAFGTLLTVGALLLVAGCSGGEKEPSSVLSSTPTLPAVSDCGTAKPVVKPKAITLTCADAGMVVQAVNWEYWGASDALGSATVTANDCNPSCAEGTDIDYPVHVLLDRVKVNGAGPQFTRATVVYQGQSPMENNTQTETADLMLYSPSTK